MNQLSDTANYLRKQHIRETYGSRLATTHGEIVTYERAIKKLAKTRELLVIKLAENGIPATSIATLSGMDLEMVTEILAGNPTSSDQPSEGD